MKRQSTRRRETNTGERCKAYADQAPVQCEVFRLLQSDALAREHLHRRRQRNAYEGRREIHHIHKRPLPLQRDYFSNLIQVSSASHEWLTANVHEGELACWMAKYDMHCHAILMAAGHGREMPGDTALLHWHVPTLDKICVPYNGIRGRLHYLLGHDVGAVFRGYGERLLKVLEAGD